jgi:NodT family efflux transporter outer membrane factor (OMF) lipoprotein
MKLFRQYEGCCAGGLEGRVEVGRGLVSILAMIAAALASVALLVLGGCASSKGISSTAQTLAPESVGLASGPESPEIAAEWWRGFHDPALTGLIERALAGNPSLKVAQARIARAYAATEGARAAAGPKLDGTLDVTRERLSANSIFPPPLGGSTVTFATGQLAGSWELDFFGRNRAAIESALGSQRAAEADLEAARILLAANIAHDYGLLGRHQEQREVAAQLLKDREQLLSLTQQRVQSGLDTNVELRQSEGAIPEARQLVEQLDEQIALTRHALAALTAQPPDALDGLTVHLRDVRTVSLPEAVPADLLGRRADVAAARARIEAAVGDVKGAKAQFYPNINLTAFFGLASIGLDQFLKAASEQYGAGPALRLPIFDAGRLRANLRGKAADLDVAIESYNGAVLEAIHDAADQIASLRSLERQRAEQARAQAAAESAYDLATQRYKAGLSTYLTVLNTESSVLSQRRLAVDLKARALDTQIALIRALGGGYVPGTQYVAQH